VAEPPPQSGPEAGGLVGLEQFEAEMRVLQQQQQERLQAHLPPPNSAKAALAKQRAVELLLSWLSPTQRDQFLREAYFTATGSGSGKTYRLFLAPMYNVFDGEGWQYCTVLPPQIGLFDIVEDRMLAQKIAIETDEGTFLLTANAVRTKLMRGPCTQDTPILRTPDSPDPRMEVLDAPTL
jgi:hypothetical protein